MAKGTLQLILAGAKPGKTLEISPIFSRFVGRLEADSSTHQHV